jgi:hypothetical protein
VTKGHTMDESIKARFDAYLAALNGSAPERYGFSVTKGKRYFKIVMTYDGGQRSVHSFVEIATGDVYKSAGWARPAEHVRFRLNDDGSFANLLTAASQKQAFAGGYLYL